MKAQKGAIVVISSHVARGTVGNRAAAFALEVLGFPVWIVPTVILPWHPGHAATAGTPARHVPPARDFSRQLADLAASPWVGEVSAVLSGYLGEPGQADAVARFVSTLKAQNPALLYALDPVMGDHGRLYVPDNQVSAIRKKLLPLADIITPNTFELSLLSGQAVAEDVRTLADQAAALPVSSVLITSAPATREGQIANLLVEKDTARLAEHARLDGPPNGLGDLTAALFLGHLVSSRDADEALEKTTGAVCEAMARAAGSNADELPLEASIDCLRKPDTSLVEMKTSAPGGDQNPGEDF